MISGENLGRQSTVVFYDEVFEHAFPVVSTYVENDTQVVVTPPNWQGSNLSVFVNVSGQESEALTFSYAPPSFVIRVNATRIPTTGGTLFEIIGVNFGRQYATFDEPDGSTSTIQIGYVTIGGVVATCPVWTPTYIQCITPEWQGLSLSVVVVSGSQASVPSLSSRSISYSPPVIEVQPNDGPWYGNTSGLYVTGYDEVLTTVLNGTENVTVPTLVPRYERQVFNISGSNFGVEGVLEFGSILIPSNSSLVRQWSHSRISVFLPEGTGKDLLIRVVAGKDANAQRTPSPCLFAQCCVFPRFTSTSR